MTHVSDQTKEKLKKEYNKLLSSVDNDIYKLLNLMTKDCEDYFKNKICNSTFLDPHYGMGGKCFPTKISQFTCAGGCEVFFLNTTRDKDKINFDIASEVAAEYSNMFVYIYDDSKNEHLLNYDNLTPLRNQTYNMVQVKKLKYIRTEQARLIDSPTCDPSKNYKYEDCVRKIIKIVY